MASTAPQSPLASGNTKLPTITLTDAALDAVHVARADAEGPFLRIDISDSFEHHLGFSEELEGDVRVGLEGVTIMLDAESAARADGLIVDFVEKDGANGFKLDNPNAEGPEKARSSAPHVPGPMPTEPPSLHVTDAAKEQFAAALEAEKEEAPGDGPFGVRVIAKRMGATRWEYSLDVIGAADREDASFEIEAHPGMLFWTDPMSSRHLNDVTIDFVTGDAGSGFKFENPLSDKGWDNPLATRFEELLEREINPGIASHGGFIELLDLHGETAYVLMGGGCQGCGMASVTLGQGIEEKVREQIPEIKRVIDSTDHAAGGNPYYTASK